MTYLGEFYPGDYGFYYSGGNVGGVSFTLVL